MNAILNFYYPSWHTDALIPTPEYWDVLCEFGRALNIREEEGDGASRLISHVGSIQELDVRFKRETNLLAISS